MKCRSGRYATRAAHENLCLFFFFLFTLSPSSHGQTSAAMCMYVSCTCERARRGLEQEKNKPQGSIKPTLVREAKRASDQEAIAFPNFQPGVKSPIRWTPSSNYHP
jgi:hypothetical protein